MKPARLALLVLLCVAAFLPGCRRDEGGGPEAALARGWKAYTTGTYDFAEIDFSAVVAAPDATEEQRRSGLLGLATTYHLRPGPDLKRARHCYERLAALPSDVAKRQGTFGLALLGIAEGRVGDARSGFQALLRDYPRSLEAGEATIHLAASHFQYTLQKDTARVYFPASDEDIRAGLRVLEERLSNHPDGHLAAIQHLLAGQKYYEAAQPRKAVEHFGAALEKGVTSRRTREDTLWRVAQIADLDLHDYQLAERYYAWFVAECPRSKMFHRGRTILARLREGGRP